MIRIWSAIVAGLICISVLVLTHGFVYIYGSIHYFSAGISEGKIIEQAEWIDRCKRGAVLRISKDKLVRCSEVGRL